jgi:CRISPR-associated protein Csb1
VFGAWNSTGEGGGLGAKFPRAMVSEIIGVNVAIDPATNKPSGQRTGSRVDPLGIRSGVRVFKTADGDWSLNGPEGKKAKDLKEVKPSEINHSNIKPSVTPLGVSIDYAIHTFVLSFAALRRLQFSGNAEADTAGRAVLAALGLVALVEQDASGYFLRSRCDLVPEHGLGDLELVRADGSTATLSLNAKAAHALLRDAVKQAEAKALRWSDKDVVLEPQPKLVELVKRSREKALRGEAEQEATA